MLKQRDMRKLDKIKNLIKTNILTEQRYLSEKSIEPTSKGDIGLANQIAQSMLKGNQLSKMEAEDWDFDGKTDTAYIDINIFPTSLPKNEWYELHFEADVDVISHGYYHPSNRSGHPDSWYPEEGENAQYGFTLKKVKLTLSNGEVNYEGVVEFSEVFKKIIEDTMKDKLNDTIDQYYSKISKDNFYNPYD